MKRSTIRALFFCLLAAACTRPYSAPAQVSPAGVPDAAVFEAVVRALADSVGSQLRVDGRPIRAGADVIGIEAADLEPASAGRAQVLQRLGVARADVIADNGCLFAQGLPLAPGAPAAPDSVLERRRRCRALPPFVSAAIGAPRRTGTSGEVVVTVVELTTSRYTARDFVLRAGADGRWEVVARRGVVNVWS